jgi:hypothetical protein
MQPADDYESSTGDNSPTTAGIILPDGNSQLHNFCNPLASDFQNDEDWIQLSVAQGKSYFFHSHAESLPTATIIGLYAQDGTTLIAEPSTPIRLFYPVGARIAWNGSSASSMSITVLLNSSSSTFLLARQLLHPLVTR